ncbi:MAG: hypothetical protein MUF76_03905 [Hydrogenophaga sp.]|jgi:hypothetical protein|nr:hypothetical protein [Hydrogenophaga sp.]
MPLERLLHKVGESAFKKKQRERIRIALSSAYCAPVWFDVPKGATQNDLAALALRSAARYWEVEPKAVACAADPSVKGLAAAMPLNVKQLLFSWAQTIGVQCKSIQPMWALAPAFPQFGSRQVCTLVEADGATTIGLQGNLDSALAGSGAGKSSEVTSGMQDEEKSPIALTWTAPTPTAVFGADGWAPFFPLVERRS